MATKDSRTALIEHVRIVSEHGFERVCNALEESLPRLRPDILDDIRDGDGRSEERELAEGPPLYIFESRDHGDILKIAGQSRRAMQYEIGNPLTATKMTRHVLATGLYAPLRVYLYEDAHGRATFEYDLPSDQFTQEQDADVAAVATQLDTALEHVLMEAAG